MTYTESHHQVQTVVSTLNWKDEAVRFWIDSHSFGDLALFQKRFHLLIGSRLTSKISDSGTFSFQFIFDSSSDCLNRLSPLTSTPSTTTRLIKTVTNFGTPTQVHPKQGVWCKSWLQSWLRQSYRSSEKSWNFIQSFDTAWYFYSSITWRQVEWIK